jgi:hypothetical protein
VTRYSDSSPWRSLVPASPARTPDALHDAGRDDALLMSDAGVQQAISVQRLDSATSTGPSGHAAARPLSTAAGLPRAR